MNWICVQDGAREHYAIPRALHREGKLALLATEFWAGPALRALRGSLGSRWHPELNGAAIISWNARYLLRQSSLALMNGQTGNRYRAFAQNGRRFSEKIRDWLVHSEVELGNKVVFSYDTTALELFGLARARGALCVVGQMDPSRAEFELVREEEKRWPGWALRATEVPEEYLVRREQEWSLAERVMVNSEFCRQALLRQGVPEEKLVVVPLCYEHKTQKCAVVTAIAKNPLQKANRQSPIAKERALRVLFLGQVLLRKGIQYLMEAARMLTKQDVVFDVVGSIGISDAAVKSAPPNVIFHGRVAREKATDWYNRAHLFLLPTLSDGFAITQLEAMAHGLPVIATANCGEVVTHGKDGFVVPIRDSPALAGAIKKYLQEPGMLATHSLAAVEKATKFGLENLSDRLKALERSTGVSERRLQPAASREGP